MIYQFFIIFCLSVFLHVYIMVFRLDEGIWLHLKSHQIGYFYPKRPIFLHVCATWNEQPSNLKTMVYMFMVFFYICLIVCLSLYLFVHYVAPMENLSLLMHFYQSNQTHILILVPCKRWYFSKWRHDEQGGEPGRCHGPRALPQVTVP